MANLAIERVLALPGTLAASTMYIVKASAATLAEIVFTSADGLEARHVINKADVDALIAAATVTGANKLTNARTISATGDATWSVSFDGSANVTSAITLANSGVTAGTYTKLTVDAKGRATTGTTLVAADIPALDAGKITTGTLTVPTSGNAGTSTKLATARSISTTGDATWTTSFDGSGDATGVITFANSGVTAGAYAKVTVDAKGRVTAGTTLAAADIPSLDAGKITTGTLTVPTSGNAATATKLATARTINGINFDGSANITINAVDSTARIAASEKGVANGVATLDATGFIPASQIPGSYDDVLEYANFAAFPATGTTGLMYVAVDTSAVYRWTGSVYLKLIAGAGLIDAALKLNTARSISATGDATWSVTFDGSANATGAITFANTVAAGTYTKLTVDTKGRATAGTTLVAADIPALDAGKITTGTLTVPTSGNAGTATKLATARSISTTGDATWTTSFDGSANATGVITLANTVTAGTYTKLTVDAKGRATAGTALVAADIPALDAGKITTGTLTVPTSGNAGTATALATSRSISITGDATWTTSFNGTANVTAAITLANSGVTAGTYTKITVDGKGRATVGGSLVAADIPVIDSTKVTSSASVTLNASEW